MCWVWQTGVAPMGQVKLATSLQRQPQWGPASVSLRVYSGIGQVSPSFAELVARQRGADRGVNPAATAPLRERPPVDRVEEGFGFSVVAGAAGAATTVQRLAHALRRPSRRR